MRGKSLFAMVAGLIIAAAGAARADETPLSVYRDALSNNPGFRAVQANRDAEHEGKAMALAGLLPSASLSGFYGRAEVDRNIADLARDNYRYDTYQLGLNLRQPLYRPYEFARYQQAGKQSEMAEAQLGSARNDLTVKTLAAYFDAAYAKTLVSLLTAQEASTQAQLLAAEKSFTAGVGTRIDISEARAQRDLILAQKLDAENQQDHTLRALQAYVGRPLASIALLSPEKFSTDLPRALDVDGWIAAAVAGNTDLAAALAQVEVAKKEISKANAGHLPTLDLMAGRTYSGNDSMSDLNNYGDTRYRQDLIGLQMSVPLYSGGGVAAGKRQAELKVKQAQLLADEMRLQLEVTVRQEYGTLAQGVLKIRAYEQAEASASERLTATRKGAQVGERSNLDVLAAEMQLYTTRRDLALARYQLLVSRLRLLSYAGQLTESDVAAISDWFGAKAEAGNKRAAVAPALIKLEKERGKRIFLKETLVVGNLSAAKS